MNKLFVFARRRATLERGEYWAAWRAAVSALLNEGPGRAVSRCVENRAIAGASVPEMTLSPFDGATELWFPEPEELAAALGDDAWRGALEAIAAEFAAPGTTIVLAAEESVQFDRGFGAVKFMALSCRAASFATRDEWIRYWVEVHGPMAHGIPEFTRYYGRYVHNYILPSEHATGGLEPEFDGIVEEWVESVDSFAQCLAEPRYLETVRPDELRFVDFSRSHVLLAEEHVVLER